VSSTVGPMKRAVVKSSSVPSTGVRSPVGQATVVEIEGVVGRQWRIAPSTVSGPGREVGVEPEAEGDRALVQRCWPVVVTVRPSRPTWYSISSRSENG
jgi:hypothetical protein